MKTRARLALGSSTAGCGGRDTRLVLHCVCNTEVLANICGLCVRHTPVERAGSILARMALARFDLQRDEPYGTGACAGVTEQVLP